MDFFIPAAMAQDAAPQAGGSPFSFIIMMVGLFAFMYFFMIRPQQKRQKEHRELVSAIKKNDEVVLTSGMLGVVVKVDENYMVLNVGNNNELKFQKGAIHAVLPKGTIKAI